MEAFPANCNAWIKFAHLERDLREYERTRGIFELGIGQPLLDQPELLWKGKHSLFFIFIFVVYIDFETEAEEYENVRKLYQRLLERTKHPKVWISYAQFEATAGNPEVKIFVSRSL